MAVAGYIIVFIIAIVINLVLANFMGQVAYAKGYDDSAHAFGMTFWLGILGCLYVVSLPDLILREQNQEILNAMKNGNALSGMQTGVGTNEQSTPPEGDLPEI